MSDSRVRSLKAWLGAEQCRDLRIVIRSRILEAKLASADALIRSMESPDPSERVTADELAYKAKVMGDFLTLIEEVRSGRNPTTNEPFLYYETVAKVTN